MALNIRPALPEEAALLAALASRTFCETFGHCYRPDDLETHLSATCSEDFFARVLAAGEDTVLLATIGKQPAGYAKAGRLGLPVDNPPPESSELQRLYVAAAWQGRGVGKALMSAALALPFMRRAAALYLGVWEHNAKAQRFYARHGFAPVGEYAYRVGCHADREIIMRKEQQL